MPSRFPQLQKPINPIAAFTQIPTTDPVENVLGRVKELEDRIGEAKFKRRYNEVRRLEVQLNRQKRYLENIGVSTGGGPSILSRVLGVVSAPVSGIAEATKRVLDPKGGSGLSDVGAAISGLGSGTFSSLTKGLEGTTSFSDVLKEHGVKGPLNAGLGLGLDIALDPTTYVTLGSSAALKGGIKGTRLASKTLGAKAGVKALEQKSVQQLGRRAVQDAKRVGNAKRIAERLGKEAMEDVALGTATRVSSKALREKAPRLQVKFLGQPILESQKAYRGLAFVGDRIGKTSTGD